ncbi:MAG: AraC family transcriptional regulator [Provencibacterium sp.]|nr:AraC family transcriptional regulator [Provencibacterium sp.]
MQIHDSCRSAIEACLKTKSFAIARLYNDEKTMSIHIHDCNEVYFSISGGKQFLIDNRVYEFGPGDIFFINQFESHYLSQVDRMTHERVVMSIHPEYLKRFSTPQTDLGYCFSCRDTPFGHRVTLTEEERRRFTYYIHRLSENGEFGQDILDQAAFLELMTYLNRIFISHCSKGADTPSAAPEGHTRHGQIDEILSYINQHLSEELSIPLLAAHFYLSGSYLCKIFKDSTGTTVNRYIIAKRISRAKALLMQGHSVAETGSLCGFRDYSNFLKAFTRIVGISPKKYASYEH